MKPPNTVQAFDALCEVQSDKASVEITSPYDGVVKELLVKEGEVAKVGAGLCVIEVEEEEGVSADDSTESPSHVEQENPDTVHDTSPSPFPDDVENEQPPSPPPTQRRPHPMDPNVPPGVPRANHADVLATPSVRHFARQNAVDLSVLAPGSGKGGRIEKKDIEAFLARPASAEESNIAANSGEDVVVQLGRTRHNMWKAMVKVCFII